MHKLLAVSFFERGHFNFVTYWRTVVRCPQIKIFGILQIISQLSIKLEDICGAVFIFVRIFSFNNNINLLWKLRIYFMWMFSALHPNRLKQQIPGCRWDGRVGDGVRAHSSDDPVDAHANSNSPIHVAVPMLSVLSSTHVLVHPFGAWKFRRPDYGLYKGLLRAAQCKTITFLCLRFILTIWYPYCTILF